jgi:hypothetical protein
MPNPQMIENLFGQNGGYQPFSSQSSFSYQIPTNFLIGSIQTNKLKETGSNDHKVKLLKDH